MSKRYNDTKSETVSEEQETAVAKVQKRPRFTYIKRNHQQNRHGGPPKHDKEPVTSQILILPLKTYFDVYVSSSGIDDMVPIIYNCLKNQDHHLSITQEELTYVTRLAFYHRMCTVSLDTASGILLPSRSILKIAASGLLLPSILASYLECIGRIELANGITVRPQISDLVTMQKWPGNKLPSQDLTEAQRLALPEARRQDWYISEDIITNYTSKVSRISKSGTGFRRVRNDVTTGRTEMLVSYDYDDKYKMTRGIAPQLMSEAECKLGACYRFRKESEREQWPGDTKIALPNYAGGKYFIESIFMAELIAKMLLEKRDEPSAHF